MPLNALGRRYSDASTSWFLGGAPSRPQKAASVHMTSRDGAVTVIEKDLEGTVRTTVIPASIYYVLLNPERISYIVSPEKQFDTYTQVFQNPNIIQSF